MENMKVKEVPLVEEGNPATYLTHTWQWDPMQDMLHLEEERDYLLYEITDTYPEEIQKIFEEYDDIISKGEHEIGNCTSVEHAIRLVSEVPVVGKMGYHTPKKHQWINEQVEIMLKNGVIEESSSLYAFNVVVVGKKDGAGEGMDRLCINYVPLNKVTIPDRYPLPNINETCSRFWGSRWITSLDLASAYWQVMVRKRDREKTAFKTRSGQYQFRVMPFGLCNAPATFQRLINKILRPYVGKFVEYVIGINGIRPDPKNIEKIKNAQVPTNTTQLRGFLGLAQYYRQYVKDYADVAGSMYDMLNNDAPEYWGPAQQTAFDNLKEKLTSEPIRAHPNFDKSFKLYTDASDTRLGAVLAQDDEKRKERRNA